MTALHTSQPRMHEHSVIMWVSHPAYPPASREQTRCPLPWAHGPWIWGRMRAEDLSCSPVSGTRLQDKGHNGRTGEPDRTGRRDGRKAQADRRTGREAACLYEGACNDSGLCIRCEMGRG